METSSYTPLPDCVTIKPSTVHGLGLFATQDIPAGTVLGTSHYFIKGWDTVIRTPLGGFYNHSENPNCKTDVNGDFDNLVVIKDISKGEELLAKYGKINNAVFL